MRCSRVECPSRVVCAPAPAVALMDHHWVIRLKQVIEDGGSSR